MEAVVVWTEFAESKLTIVFNYYKEKASLKIATQITKEIVKASMKLEKQPFIGALEPLLEARAKEYRYLVQGNYKIIHFFEKEKNEVVIAHLFDSRQNPSKIEETK
jgi:toxin ParE1/3/4